jgi:hypothetical protein
MQHVTELGLGMAVQKRFHELQSWTDHHELGRRLAAEMEEARELGATLAQGMCRADQVEVLPKATEIVRCIDRLATAPHCVVAPEHVVARRALTRDWVGRLYTTSPELFPGNVRQDTEDAVDAAFVHVPNLRKPGVVAVAVLMLTLRGQTISQLRETGRTPSGHVHRLFL